MSQTFMHTGFGAGPAVFTDATGHVVEERRIEPFGAPIGSHDLVARDLNPLGKRTDPATGWSDQGARWMAPEAARWLTPDPAVDGPDVGLMASPWNLHPYQYVASNPIAYWDPDGREPRAVDERTARAAFENWKNTWAEFGNRATVLLRAESARLRDADPVGFTEATNRYELGDRGALGESYRRLDEAQQMASAELSQWHSVLTTIEGQALKGRVPSFEELSRQAAAGAKVAAVVQFVGLAMVGEAMRFGPEPPAPAPVRKDYRLFEIRGVNAAGRPTNRVAGEIDRPYSEPPFKRETGVMVDPDYEDDADGEGHPVKYPESTEIEPWHGETAEIPVDPSWQD